MSKTDRLLPLSDLQRAVELAYRLITGVPQRKAASLSRGLGHFQTGWEPPTHRPGARKRGRGVFLNQHPDLSAAGRRAQDEDYHSWWPAPR